MIASTIKFFRDHLTFLDEVMSEEKKKDGLLDLATQLKLKQETFAKERGIQLHGELKDRKGSEGICHSVMLETLCVAGTGERWVGLAYAARWRDGVHGVRHWDDGCFQCVVHERHPRERAGVGEGDR